MIATQVMEAEIELAVPASAPERATSRASWRKEARRHCSGVVMGAYVNGVSTREVDLMR
jgi:transposase-like protein